MLLLIKGLKTYNYVIQVFLDGVTDSYLHEYLKQENIV